MWRSSCVGTLGLSTTSSALLLIQTYFRNATSIKLNLQLKPSSNRRSNPSSKRSCLEVEFASKVKSKVEFNITQKWVQQRSSAETCFRWFCIFFWKSKLFRRGAETDLRTRPDQFLRWLFWGERSKMVIQPVHRKRHQSKTGKKKWRNGEKNRKGNWRTTRTNK